MKHILFVIIFSTLFHARSFSGGFQVNLQGQKQTGMGHCGTGLVLGASNAFFNPGGFALVDSIHISLGGSFISSNIKYLEPWPGIYTVETSSKVGTPFSFYSAFRIKKKHPVNFGLAVYTPFGSGIQYPDDWKGRFILREMALKTVFFQPTLGLRINEKIGIGIGYVYGIGEFSLRKGLPVQDQQDNYGEGVLTGSSAGHGFNAGIFVQPVEKWSFGLNYRSSLTIAVDSGEARFTVPSYLKDSLPNTSFSAEIKLPQVFSFGAACSVSEKSTLLLDVNYVGWSVYDTLAFDFADNTSQLVDMNSPRKYKDAFIFRLGWEYRYDDKLTVRAGAYYDRTPVQDGYITPETPDADKLGLTTGFSFRFTRHFCADVSVLFIEGRARTGTNLETGFGGTWKAKALVPGIGLEFQF